jgi:AraC-like DNA-binding protein
MILLAISTKLILVISSAGVIQALLLAGILYFHHRSDKSVTKFLSLHILSVSIFMLMPVVQQLFSWQIIIALLPFQFLIGPLLYLYVRSFKEVITVRKAWLHFLLFFISAITNYYLYTTWVYKYPVSNEIPPEILFDPKSYVQIFIRNLQMLVYFFLAKRVLTSYQKSINHLFSETSRISLVWVRWLINGFLFLIITVLVLVYFVFKYPEHFNLWILINTAVITPYIYLVTFKGISQPTLWQIQLNVNKETVEKEMHEAEEIQVVHYENPKPSKSGVSLDKINETVKNITLLMEKEKLYQETELTLQQLANKLQLPTYQVSQVINEGLKRNFYDLVNGYRVEEAKRLLLDPKNDNYTILSVGFEAGFNSKTTFHTVFKKFTGLTATEFREKNKSVPA